MSRPLCLSALDRGAPVVVRFRPANRQMMREINESIVLGLIREHGPISRVDIARTAHLSAATVTGIATALLDQGLVIEHAGGVSTGGRRPIPLAFNATAGVALGIKITERALVCAVTDLAAAVEEHRTVPLPPGPTPEQVVALVADEADRVRQAHPDRRLAGIGIGIAGIIDRPSGVCRVSPFLRWHDVPIRDRIEQAIGAPVVVENDVNTLTHAFHAEAVLPDTGSCLVVTLGRGIGLGMLLEGVPFRGARGQGGEFGHIVVEPDGPLCECGNLGCLEAIASIPALLRDATALLGIPLTEPALRQRIEAGDAELAPLADRTADVLARGLAVLVNLLNPHEIVISGEGAWLAAHLLPRIERSLREGAFDRLADDLHLRVDDRGDEFWAAGASGVLLQDLFRPRIERADSLGDTARVVSW